MLTELQLFSVPWWLDVIILFCGYVFLDVGVENVAHSIRNDEGPSQQQVDEVRRRQAWTVLVIGGVLVVYAAFDLGVKVFS